MVTYTNWCFQHHCSRCLYGCMCVWEPKHEFCNHFYKCSSSIPHTPEPGRLLWQTASRQRLQGVIKSSRFVTFGTAVCTSAVLNIYGKQYEQQILLQSGDLSLSQSSHATPDFITAKNWYCVSGVNKFVKVLNAWKTWLVLLCMSKQKRSLRIMWWCCYLLMTSAIQKLLVFRVTRELLWLSLIIQCVYHHISY